MLSVKDAPEFGLLSLREGVWTTESGAYGAGLMAVYV